MNTINESPAQVKPAATPPELSRQAWLEQAAAAVRWLRKDSKPSSDKNDEYYAENCLWKAAEGRAHSEKMPRQLVVTVRVGIDGGGYVQTEYGSVRILDKDERTFVVDLPEAGTQHASPSTPRCWNPLELANHVFPGEQEEADNA